MNITTKIKGIHLKGLPSPLEFPLKAPISIGNSKNT